MSIEASSRRSELSSPSAPTTLPGQPCPRLGTVLSGVPALVPAFPSLTVSSSVTVFPKCFLDVTPRLHPLSPPRFVSSPGQRHRPSPCLLASSPPPDPGSPPRWPPESWLCPQVRHLGKALPAGPDPKSQCPSPEPPAPHAPAPLPRCLTPPGHALSLTLTALLSLPYKTLPAFEAQIEYHVLCKTCPVL